MKFHEINVLENLLDEQNFTIVRFDLQLIMHLAFNMP